MDGPEIRASQFVFVILLLIVVAFGALARRLRTPYPIVLVIAGLMLSLVPGIPRPSLDPDMVFFVILPPLLYGAAWNTSWRQFRHNLVSICSLAFGLVGFTVAGVALAATWILPGFDWRSGFVLGAVASTTDAIAATSIARTMGLPRRIVDVLEGESLINDASGLLALELAVLLISLGRLPAAGFAISRLAWLIVAGLGVGVLLAVLVDWFERRIDDGPIEIAISILVPYAAYLIAEEIHGSGVLAVVAAGLYLSPRSAHFFSPAVRLQANAVWGALTFVLNGLVFALIGMQLPVVALGMRGASVQSMLAAGALFSALVIALRLVWVFPGARVSYFIRRRLLHQDDQIPPARHLVIIGWAGMRGVIALAAAMSLPTFANGEPFPHRSEIVFLTFCVILSTLVLQGLTLPPLIRMLGVSEPPGAECGEREAHRIVLEAALTRVDSMREGAPAAMDPVYDNIARYYRRRIGALSTSSERDDDPLSYGDILLGLLRVERDAALRLRDDHRIDDEELRNLEYELDLREARLVAARRHTHDRAPPQG
jgi:Na+/H+ antiporter